MKQIIFAAALCAGVISSSAAFADRWAEPVNGTVSAVLMADGDVMMKVQIPAKEFQIMDRDMKANNNACFIKEVYSEASNTMILVCGPAR